MASTPFGEHLKRERELRGVTLEEVAAATRIKPGFLEALESGRWDQLPGGAFNRGFIRATARFLGLDEDGMVAEYALETGAASLSKAEPSGAMPRDYRPAAVLLSVFVLAIIAAAWFGHRLYVLHRHRQAAAQQLSPIQAPQIPASSRPYSPAVIATPSVVNAAPPPADNDSQPPARAAADASPSARADRTSVAPLQLQIETPKRTEVKVTADGSTLFEGRLGSGTSKAFEARDRFEVTAVEPGRVQITLNGRTIPFRAPNGRRGGTISLTKQDLQARQDASR